MIIAIPLKKVIPSFPATPSKGQGPVKLPLFENLVEGLTLPPPAERGVVHIINTLHNIHTFTHQKASFHALLLLVFKIPKSLQCILKII